MLTEEQRASLARLPAGSEQHFTADRFPIEQRRAALKVWTGIVSAEPHIAPPECGYDQVQELYFSWRRPKFSLEVAVEEDGIITWSFTHHEHKIFLSSDENPANGYLVFLHQFRSPVIALGKHARVWDGPGTGTHGFVLGTRAEDGHVLLDTRDGVHIFPPEFVR